MSRPAPAARRWPDLLIGLLVALLLVGFALLLFRPEGRPAAQTSAPPVTDASSPPATIPAAPGTDSAVAAPEAAPAVSVPDAAATATPPPAEPVTTPTDAEPPTIAAAPAITPAPQSSSPEASAESGEAAAPDTATNEAPEDTAAEAPSAEPVTPDATPEDATAEDNAPAAAPRSGGAVATSGQRTPLRSDYRISLGTFGSEQDARAGTAGVSTLGYTVYPIDLGSTVVAQIGPFADEASARQALADIQRAYPRALLYPPRDRNLSSGNSSGAGSGSTSTSPSTPAASAPAAPAPEEAAPAPAPSGPTYLQVGAFDRVESAQRLVSQLRDLGYAPTVNAPEGRKVSVLVGPFTGDALTRTETRLSGNGLDHFRVR